MGFFRWVFLGGFFNANPVLDPDPHVFVPPGYESGSIGQRCGSGSGSGSCCNPSIIKQNSKKNLDSYSFVTSFGLFIFEK